ncbi:NifB/NifX family molybdenum-iron cluster-binding protein [Desulfovibrio inopinatus]|uniref:NifB/NifX family molybdenum-iron cluster-binding protein n=1 Tax=Desulfovibrio inopinatus TaxID=102109 RepID=UPI000418E775|nr:hypothetical protein [Desulfovibrio inopinatus]
MSKKVLIPLHENDVAPRFDLADEVWVGVVDEEAGVSEEHTVVLPQASAEGLCAMILHEHIDIVVCCGIEEEYYQYLVWKHVDVYDSVVGTVDQVVSALLQKKLAAGQVLLQRDQVSCSVS